MPLFFLTIFLFLTCTCCQQNTKDSSLKIYGRWILDSTSGKGGEIRSGGPREHTEFTLHTDNSFIFEWSDFDVSNSYRGTYKYEKTTDTAFPVLIFSIYSNEIRDSIVAMDSLIVLELTDAILKTREKESYTLLDSTLLMANRINVYRKTLSTKN